MSGGSEKAGASFARANLIRAVSAYDSAVERAATEGTRENERAIRFAAEAVVTAARRAIKHIGSRDDE